MSTAETIEPMSAAAAPANRVEMPLGLLGFEQFKDYALLSNPAEKPFAWLKAVADEPLSFVVIDPFVVLPDYKPEIPEADVAFLGIKQPSDAVLLGIVTIHAPNRVTMNLRGPVVINRHSHIAKQVIIANAADYSVHHPLSVAA